MIAVALAILGIWVLGGVVTLVRTRQSTIARPYRAWLLEVSGIRVRTEGEVLDPGLERRHLYGVRSRHRAVLRFYDDRGVPVTVIEQHDVFRPLSAGMSVPIAYDPRNPLGRGAIDDFTFYRNRAPFLGVLTIWILGLLLGLAALLAAL